MTIKKMKVWGFPQWSSGQDSALPLEPGCTGSIPGLETKILHATWCSPIKIKKKKATWNQKGEMKLGRRLWP